MSQTAVNQFNNVPVGGRWSLVLGLDDRLIFLEEALGRLKLRLRASMTCKTQVTFPKKALKLSRQKYEGGLYPPLQAR